mgnify:CR=1 FL=1
MRGNIIEELYYGNIDPQDRGYHPQSPVKKVSDSLNDLEEKLSHSCVDSVANEVCVKSLENCSAWKDL